jgi:inositol transporter-like SP family MFS transporter
MNEGVGTCRKATIAVSLTNFLDSGCIVAGASGLSLWSMHFGLSSFAVGLLGAVSANAFGSAIGALIGGSLADQYGRKFIMTYNMLVYMLGALLVVFSVNFVMLLAGFLILGLSVGAGVPASWTYLSEIAESTSRARNIGMSQFAWSLGPAIIFSLGVTLAPLNLLGNRILFAVLFSVAFVAWFLQCQLEESQAFEEEKARRSIEGRPKTSIKDLISTKVNIGALGFLIGVYLFWNLVAGAMGFFMPFVYETVGGLTNLEANLLQSVLWIFTAGATYFGFAKLGDKVDQRKLFFIGALMAVISWSVLTFVGMNWTALWTFVIIWGVSAGIGAQAFYALWATELFAAKYRGGAQGIMFFTVRGACGIWSILFPVILNSLGFTFAGTVMIGLLIISLLIGTIWAPKTQGKTLKELEQERYGEI